MTTWIYGPIPLLGEGPAALIPGVIPSLLASDALNLLLIAGALVCAVIRMAPPEASRATKTWACLLVVAALQHTNFIFVQADNWVTACGFGMLAVLGRNQRPAVGRLWFAAGLSTLALFCKQTALGPALGLIVWVWLHAGWRAGLRQIYRCLICGGVIGLLCLLIFDPAGMLFNMFIIPAHIPWMHLWGKMIHPIYLPGIIVFLIAPAVLLIAGWLFTGRKGISTFSPGVWMFWASLLPNLAGFSTAGGNLNSFHGVNFLLPGLAWGLLSMLRERPALVREGLQTAVFAGLLTFQISEASDLAVTPKVTALRQGLFLARQLPDCVFFPWNPLFNYEVSKRFDHSEDGILTRTLAGQPVTLAELHRHLPPDLCVVAYQGSYYHSLLVKVLAPHDAQKRAFGLWTLTDWPPPGKPPTPAKASSQP